MPRSNGSSAVDPAAFDAFTNPIFPDCVLDAWMVNRNRSLNSSPPFRIAFVCTGNICRSPLAEALAWTHAKRVRLNEAAMFESFGTHDYHVGDPADSRSIAVAREFGVDLTGHRARQVTARQFDHFDLFFAMDGDHERFLRRLSPAGADDNRIKRYLPFVAPDEGNDVPDPYCGDRDGFVAVHRLLDRAARALIERLPALIAQRHG
jgi:protein-tyrosine phosphatase